MLTVLWVRPDSRRALPGERAWMTSHFPRSHCAGRSGLENPAAHPLRPPYSGELGLHIVLILRQRGASSREGEVNTWLVVILRVDEGHLELKLLEPVVQVQDALFVISERQDRAVRSCQRGLRLCFVHRDKANTTRAYVSWHSARGQDYCPSVRSKPGDIRLLYLLSHPTRRVASRPASESSQVWQVWLERKVWRCNGSRPWLAWLRGWANGANHLPAPQVPSHPSNPSIHRLIQPGSDMDENGPHGSRPMNLYLCKYMPTLLYVPP